MHFPGWQDVYDGEEMLGVAGPNGGSLWFASGAKDTANNYDGPGMNHTAIATAAQKDVDATVAFPREHGVQPLFETPRHRREWATDAMQTYYQVKFD